MNLLNISMKSLSRQKGKKAFLVGAMTISLVTILILLAYVESHRMDIEKQFDEFGANIIITPKSDNLVLSYGGVNISGIVTHMEEIESSDVPAIYEIENNKNIRAVSPKLIGAGEISLRGLENKALLVGIDLEEEKKIKGWWKLVGRFPEGPREALVGSSAAQKLNINLGDTIEVKDEQLRITAILNTTGGQDDNAILAPMETVQQILDKPGKISLIEVSALCNDCPIDDLVQQISMVMPDSDVKAIRQVMEQRMQVVDQVETITLTVALLLILFCSLLIFSNVTGSISERKKEIGIFRALGYKKSDIMAIILSESFVLGIISSVLAITVSFGALYWLPSIPGLGEMTYRLNLTYAFYGLIALLLLSIGSSFRPALKASKMDPVSSIGSL